MTSNYTFPTSIKLERLKKATLSYQKGKIPFRIKYNTKWVYSVISIMLVLALTTLSISSAFATTRSNIQAKQSLLSTLLKQLILSPLDASAEQLKVEVHGTLEPITQLAGGDYLTNSIVDDATSLLYEYGKVFAPLIQYTVSKDGFTHKKDTNRVFTQDLELVFTKLESLISITNDKYNTYWLQRGLAWALGGANVRDNLTKIDSLLIGIREIVSNKNQILTALGHYGRQRILLLNQNIGESRPTGGFTGSYIPIDIIQGKLEIGQSQSIYYIAGQSQEKVVLHPAYWMFGYLYGVDYMNNTGLINAQFTSCFPDFAYQLNQEFSKSKNGFSIDQIYMISPKIIESLLPDNFTTSVEDIGVINKSNFLNEIERNTSLEYEKALNPKEAISPIFTSLFDILPQIIEQQSGEIIIGKILDGIYARDISIWSADKGQQSLVSKLGLAAEQTCLKKDQAYDTISPIVANMSGDKRGLIAQMSTSISSQAVYGGKRVQLTFNQNLPVLKDLQRGFNTEYPMNMFGFQIPGDAFNIQIETNDNYRLPFLRSGFKEILDANKHEFKLSDPISKIIESSYDITNGFVYSQNDGSKVVASYMRDNPVGDTTLTISFTIPRVSGQELRYYGQVGLGSPQIIIGEGIDNPEDYTESELINPIQIQKGLKLRYR